MTYHRGDIWAFLTIGPRSVAVNAMRGSPGYVHTIDYSPGEPSILIHQHHDLFAALAWLDGAGERPPAKEHSKPLLKPADLP